MITKNEKAKGLWWRLLATLPVLAVLLVANTKVTAQKKKAENQPFTIEIAGSFEIYDDDGFPIQLKDTVIYNEDGSYVKYVTSDDIDPETGKLTPKMTITTHKADGSSAGYMNLNWDINDGVARYTDDDFSISADESLLIFLESLSTLGDKPENDSTFQVVKDELYRSLLDQAVNDTVFDIVDEMPEFPGGIDAMTGFVASNIKYPQDAIDEGKEGRVFVSFVVEKDGWVSNVKVLKGVCESIDEEAARVVRGMPRWKPGMKDGKPARVSFQLPVTFKLDQMNNEYKTIVRTVIAEDESGEHSTKSSTATYPDDPIKDNMKPDKNGVYQIVEEMPQFPGGDKALIKYVSDNITYPQEAKDKEVQGRVFVGFIVEKDGSVNEVKVLRSIGGGCDEEAVRVIKSMPKWKPGKQKGKPVRVSYMMPINFKLDDGPSSKGLENTLYMGEGTGKKDGVTYTMKMNMEFESKTTGYFVMTLTSQKKNEIAKVDFEDVGLPFTYTFDGKSSGSIQPTNPDGGQLGDEPMPPYGFLINKDGSITVSFYDFKKDIGIEQIVFKKVVK